MVNKEHSVFSSKFDPRPSTGVSNRSDVTESTHTSAVRQVVPDGVLALKLHAQAKRVSTAASVHLVRRVRVLERVLLASIIHVCDIECDGRPPIAIQDRIEIDA